MISMPYCNWKGIWCSQKKKIFYCRFLLAMLGIYFCKDSLFTDENKYIWPIKNYFVSCMLYWIYLMVCEHSMLCHIVYFVLQNVFFVAFIVNTTFGNIQYTYFSFTQFGSTKPLQLLKTYENICVSISDFYLKIINNNCTLLFNHSTIHSIQQYNGLYELTNCVWMQIYKKLNRKLTRRTIKHDVEHVMEWKAYSATGV